MVLTSILLAPWLSDVSIARTVRPMNGTIVMFDTTADESAVWCSVTIDLDDGGVVHATNPMKLTTGVGTRVELAEKTGWLIRRKRVRSE